MSQSLHPKHFLGSAEFPLEPRNCVPHRMSSVRRSLMNQSCCVDIFAKRTWEAHHANSCYSLYALYVPYALWSVQITIFTSRFSCEIYQMMAAAPKRSSQPSLAFSLDSTRSYYSIPSFAQSIPSPISHGRHPTRIPPFPSRQRFRRSLRSPQLPVVQSSILGSILSNLLLVLGLCFLLGGLRFPEQRFNPVAAGMSASLMSISVLGMMLPAALQAQMGSGVEEGVEESVLWVSRWTSLILLFVYGLYLLFQLRTHAYLYLDDSELAEHAEEPAISAWFALGLLVGSTVLVAVCAEGLVGAIEGVSEKVGMGSVFVGFILL